MKLDILAFGAHPDDVELSCGGTIMAHIAAGKTAGIIDLSRGELGTRGTAAIRQKEATAAAAILGVSIRENLNFKDGFITNDKPHQLKVIHTIRKYRPEIILANALDDRHPDHGNAAGLVRDAAFLSGLVKLKTKDKDKRQIPWRPRMVMHYVQAWEREPNIIVDISNVIEQKMQAIKAYRSQFYNPGSKAPETYISDRSFLQLIEARAINYGHRVGVRYGEGFIVQRNIGIDNLFNLL